MKQKKQSRSKRTQEETNEHRGKQNDLRGQRTNAESEEADRKKGQGGNICTRVKQRSQEEKKERKWDQMA